MLLSDTELLDIFTRDLLNRLRQPAAPFPLFTVEFDNPDFKAHRPARWSVFTNLMMLRDLVERAVFGPVKLITDMSALGPGRPEKGKMDGYMREQLKLTEVLPSEIDEGEQSLTLHIDTIANEVFPQHNKEARERIEARFMEVWGEAILHVLGGFRPWRKHIDAVSEIERGWVTEDTVCGLAKDALFEGVGKYWTLRDTAAHWKERLTEGKASEREAPEIVKAWRLIDREERQSSKFKEFIALRAAHYLEKTDAASVRSSEALFGSVNTYACQLGAILTVATLRHYHPALSPRQVAELCVVAWNAAIEEGPSRSRNRRLLLSRDEERPLNMLGKMDSPDAVYYRYFFLELLNSDEARPRWEGVLTPAVVERLCSNTRAVYMACLVGESEKALKRTKPSLSEAERKREATSQVKDNLADALKHWFRWTRPQFDAWFKGRRATVSIPEPQPEPAEPAAPLDPDAELEQLFTDEG